MTFEFCIDGIEGALAAQKYGAKRVELCAALSVGGLTPSYGLIEQCVNSVDTEVHVMIRHVEGGFVYAEKDIEIMKNDIIAAKKANAKGVVFGCLTTQNEVDINHTKSLVNLAKSLGLAVTFHRAFDFCKAPLIALEQLIELGVDRILTSGGKDKAIDGIDLIEQLVTQANGRIEIMAGSGVNASNAKQLAETGIDALHFTIHKQSENITNLGMGNRNEIDEDKITSILNQF